MSSASATSVDLKDLGPSLSLKCVQLDKKAKATQPSAVEVSAEISLARIRLVVVVLRNRNVKETVLLS
jgi:hypothetical protein